jgi:hypothetical protein
MFSSRRLDVNIESATPTTNVITLLITACSVDKVGIV